MNNLIYITGGARSGKSTLATELAGASGKQVTFIATCVPGDSEMKARVKNHRISRPKSWKTILEPEDLSKAVLKAAKTPGIIIIDCLTLYVSNLVCAGKPEPFVSQNIRRLIKTIKSIENTVIIVSNEVGLGIVPDNKLARDFRDIAGKANQLAAEASKEAYFMVSGMKIKLK